MNRGTSRRSLWHPQGDLSVQAVIDGNTFMARTACHCILNSDMCWYPNNCINTYLLWCCALVIASSMRTCCDVVLFVRTALLCLLTCWNGAFFMVESVASSTLPLYPRWIYVWQHITVLPLCCWDWVTCSKWLSVIPLLWFFMFYVCCSIAASVCLPVIWYIIMYFVRWGIQAACVLGGIWLPECETCVHLVEYTGYWVPGNHSGWCSSCASRGEVVILKLLVSDIHISKWLAVFPFLQPFLVCLQGRGQENARTYINQHGDRRCTGTDLLQSTQLLA